MTMSAVTESPVSTATPAPSPTTQPTRTPRARLGLGLGLGRTPTLLLLLSVALAAFVSSLVPLVLPQHDASRYPAQRATPPGTARMQVVGCGLPRTGTESTREALRLLGFGDDSPASEVHHMFVAFERGTLPEWARVVRALNASDEATTRERRALVRSLLSGFRAGLDFPVALVYKDFLDDPDVKFVLTVRDSRETWYQSVHETLGMQDAFATWRGPGWDEYGWLRVLGLWITARVVPGPNRLLRFHEATVDANLRFIGAPREEALRMYDAWNAEVRRVVPKHRLLEFNVKQGWGPLVEFLGVPRPDVPFPNGNDRGALARSFLIASLVGYAVVALVALAAWGLVRAVAFARGYGGAVSEGFEDDLVKKKRM